MYFKYIFLFLFIGCTTTDKTSPSEMGATQNTFMLDPSDVTDDYLEQNGFKKLNENGDTSTEDSQQDARKRVKTIFDDNYDSDTNSIPPTSIVRRRVNQERPKILPQNTCANYIDSYLRDIEKVGMRYSIHRVRLGVIIVPTDSNSERFLIMSDANTLQMTGSRVNVVSCLEDGVYYNIYYN